MTKKLFFSLLFAITFLYSQDRALTTGSSDWLNPSIEQSISVTIGGEFFATGTYPASPNERVDQFLTRIINATKKANGYNNNDLNNNYSKRTIVLKRFNGETINVDLLKFEVTGDYKQNPLLKNDDVLIILPFNLEKNFVTIDGAVNAPKTFQFVEGDKLSDAILFAQGISPVYNKVDSATISRLSYNGEKEEVIYVLISDNPVLQRGDRVKIIALESERKDYKAYVAGEVNNQGNVSITKNSTTIRQIIEKAGGFKDNADLNRSEIIRGANVFHSTLFTEDMEMALMSRKSRLKEEDSLPFIIDNKLRFSRGNGTVDFNKIFDENANDGNFIVKTGDYIFIPEKLNLVYVFGQVSSPGYVVFVNGKDYRFYLEKSGGLAVTAKKEVYLIKGKTRNWVSLTKQDRNQENDVVVEAGDYIWVPKKPIRSFGFYLQKTGSISAVVGGILTLIVLLIQVSK